ncbi:hypothetical protein C4578_03480 [Candidatus Microgenomates bacterium]|jgi:hypothetical protein|nr:MAG: hypothetical protein C4578_03480 [Candidatus Microgenomates bacterium]
MLKRVLTLVLVFTFAFSVLFVSVKNATISAPSSFAVTSLKLTVSEESSASAEATPTAVPKSDYFLAYPGILPDNPLYKIKMIRDRVKIWLVRKTLDRASLFLLYSDKRLGAGKVLVEGGKPEMGIPTLVKAERYFEKAILETEKAKAQGIETAEFRETLRKASLKHEEVLKEVKERVDSSGKEAVDDLLKYMSPVKAKLNGI